MEELKMIKLILFVFLFSIFITKLLKDVKKDLAYLEEKI